MAYFLFGVFKLLDNKTHHHNIAASLVVTIIKKVMDNPDKKTPWPKPVTVSEPILERWYRQRAIFLINQ